MAKQRICKECKKPLGKGERMNAHWQEKHPNKYHQIQAWLGESDAKIRAAEVLAAEGMKGPGAQSEVPQMILRPSHVNQAKSLVAMPIAATSVKDKEAEEFFEEILAKEGLGEK